MPQVFTSTVVGAPVGEVWALLRDFAAIGSWHPALPRCEIEGGPADRVGCVRVFPLGGDHRETLVSLDGQHRAIAFTSATTPPGCVSAGTFPRWPVPITLSDHACVEWSSQFDCDEADEDKMITQVRDCVLTPGLRRSNNGSVPSVTATGPDEVGPGGVTRTSSIPEDGHCQLIAGRICRSWAVAG